MRAWQLPLLCAVGLFSCFPAVAQGSEEPEHMEQITVTYYYLPG